MNPVTDIDKLRDRLTKANEAVARRTGELVAAVRDTPTIFPDVVSALTRLDHAEAAATAAHRRVVEAKRATTSDEERDAHIWMQRVSALIAVHAMRTVIVKDGDALYPWRVVLPGGGRKRLPQYAIEVGTIAPAERQLTPEQQERYGLYLADRFGMNFHRIATANAYMRAIAVLYALGVDPNSDPTVNEPEKQPLPPSYDESVNHALGRDRR